MMMMRELMSGNFYEKAIPFLGVVFLQFGYAGMSIISKSALNQGMSPYVLAVYRHAVATIVIAPFAFFFDRKVRPQMTTSIFFKILLLGLLEPTIDQNLYYTGMKMTTATFSSAMTNVLPAFAFLMAWILRLETVNGRKLHSQAKIIGTLVTIGGAFIMTSVKGAALNLPWTKMSPNMSAEEATKTPMKGAIMIVVGCFSWAGFITLQAITLKRYPAALSLTVLICLSGAIEGSILAAIMERNNPAAWAIFHFDSKLLSVVYSGVVCSGIAYCVQGMIMKSRGPVFVSSFNPLNMILVAIMSTIFLSETLYVGRILGAGVIILGLYLVLWGKSKDQPETSNAINDEIALGAQQQQVIDENKGNQEFITIDFARHT